MQKPKDYKPFLPAEQMLMDGSILGDRVTLGDGTLPHNGSINVDVRAEFIRSLLLSTDAKAPLHAKGIRLRGARILGSLDLQGVECEHDLTLTRCYFEKRPIFLNSRMRGLNLGGSSCPGLVADNANFAGSVYLRNEFVSTREISMPNVRISGDLQICNAHLSSEGHTCLFATSARIEGSIYLGDYPYDEDDSDLHANGAIIFSSATIANDVYCKNCAISANETASNISNIIDEQHGVLPSILSFEEAEIDGLFYCKNNQFSKGILNLAGAQVRRLNDEPAPISSSYKIRLDGFIYQDFAQEADTSTKSRLIWLERRPKGISFSTQPFEQLARVLDNIGHQEGARDILMQKERLRRKENIRDIMSTKTDIWRIPFLLTSNFLLRYLIGYGYRPIFAVVWGIVLIAGLSVLFQKAWDMGDMAPNSSPILVSKDWISATETHPENPAKFWSSKDQAGKDYETFNAVAYATDLVIPIVNLGQESAWAPSTSRGILGKQGWWVRWFAKGIGWIITALAAAAITGVIRRD